MTKDEIRAEMRRLRRQVPPSERRAAASRICASLEALVASESSRASCIAVYLASTDEIDLAAFIDACLARCLRLVAPRWNGSAYEMATLDGFWPDRLVPGPHGILEPPREAIRVDASDVDLWIVPGLAFTKNGARLGYGGGWYDRLMHGSKGRRVGVCHRFQILDALPTEPHDLPLDALVCGDRLQPIDFGAEM